MNTAARHHFKNFRDHQRNVFADGGGVLTVYPSGRTELSYGSAPYGEHALSAWRMAKTHVHSLARFAKDAADHRKRSAARPTRADDNAAYRRDMINAGRGHLLR